MDDELDAYMCGIDDGLKGIPCRQDYDNNVFLLAAYKKGWGEGINVCFKLIKQQKNDHFRASR